MHMDRFLLYVMAKKKFLFIYLPLAKAKPISNGGSTSVVTYLRRGGKKKSVTANFAVGWRHQNM